MTIVVIPNRPKPNEARDINAILANFDAVTSGINGKLDKSNYKALSVDTESLGEQSVTAAKLATAVAVSASVNAPGVKAKQVVEIATEQSRENVAYGLMATPDEVTVELPANGLIVLGFRADFKNSVAEAGRAAIFLNANQLILCTNASNQYVVQETAPHAGLSFCPLISYELGLFVSQTSTAVGVRPTTGVVLGFGAPTEPGGLAVIEAVAGTYKLSVQYKASSGNVTVKNRKLWAAARSFS